MRLRQHRAPALLFFIPALHALAATIPTDAEEAQIARVLGPGAVHVSTISTAAASPTSKANKATKDAPVDGLDGKPHAGPFVEDKPAPVVKQPGGIEELRPAATPTTKVSSTKPSKELTKEEWAALGAEGDGVMDDKNRQAPKGNTGTEGGVSAKEKEKKEQETKTGEKAEQIPQPPKEALPHPQGEQETLKGDQDTKTSTRKAGAQGLAVFTPTLIMETND